MESGILSGVRVIDFGRYIAGPYCATLLGYLGAEVIRVERRSGGEDRYIAPLFDQEDGAAGEGALFFQTGCNKKSMTLNPATEEGRAVMHQLIETADVFIANLPVQALTRLGLDYETLKALRPELVYVSISTFGSTGPDAKKGGFDGIGQAMSGAMYMTGTPGNPVKAAAAYVDYSTAVLSGFGVLAALIERQKTGKGQQVEASLLGSALSVFGSHLVEQGALGIDRPPTGNRVQTSAPSDVFATKDGHVLVHVVGGGLFKRVATLIGREDWLNEPAYEGDQARGDNRDTICGVVADWCFERTTDEALAAFADAGVPAGKVNTLQEAIDHPQVAAMEHLKQVAVAGMAGTAPVPDLPLRFSDSDTGIKTPPPALGDATDAVLKELGYDETMIARLREDGIV